MRTAVAIFAVTTGLMLASTANAQTHSVSEWRVGAETGSFATIIVLEVSTPPVLVYRICHTKGAAIGLAIKINCAPDGRIAPDPTKGASSGPSYQTRARTLLQGNRLQYVVPPPVLERTAGRSNCSRLGSTYMLPPRIVCRRA